MEAWPLRRDLALEGTDANSGRAALSEEGARPSYGRLGGGTCPRRPPALLTVP